MRDRPAFDWQSVSIVFKANQAIGRPSPLIGRDSFLRFLGDTNRNRTPSRDLYVSANFWIARAYATDNGGEIVQMTIEAAQHFERIYTSSEARTALKAQWEKGLRAAGPDRATEAVVQLLGNDEALKRI